MKSKMLPSQPADTLLNVANTNTFDKLKNLGFRGPDVDIKTSLREYGFACSKSSDETVFIYGVKQSNDSGEYVKFDRCTFNTNLDVYKEFNWIKDWDHEIFCYFDHDKEYFDNDLDLGQKIYCLFLIYGYENVFGSSYWGGFEISGDEES